MFVCKVCRSTSIKTRTNSRFSKTYATAVCCKNCGSTAIEKVEKDSRRRNWGPPKGGQQQRGGPGGFPGQRPAPRAEPNKS